MFNECFMGHVTLKKCGVIITATSAPQSADFLVNSIVPFVHSKPVPTSIFFDGGIDFLAALTSPSFSSSFKKTGSLLEPNIR